MLQGALALVCAFAGVGGVVSILLRPIALRLPYSAYKTDVSYVKEVGEQFVGYARLMRLDDSKDGAARRLNIVLGSSNSECGVDPGLLSRMDPQSRVWLNLATSGPNPSDWLLVFDLLDRLGVKADVLIMVVNRFMLAESTTFLDRDERFDLAELRRHVKNRVLGFIELDLEKLALEPFHSLLPYRARVENMSDHAKFEARLKLLTLFKQPPSAYFAAKVPPWTGFRWIKEGQNLDGPGPGPVPDKFAAERLADSYKPGSKTSETFVDVLNLARSRCRTFVLLLCPEMEVTRRIVPREAYTLFEDVLDKAGRDGFAVIDHSESLPDRFFGNWVHLNKLGRDRLTELIAKDLETLP